MKTEAKFFKDGEREMVSFWLSGKGSDAVNTMTVSRLKKEHAGIWREVAAEHAAWSGGAGKEAPAKSDDPVATDEASDEAPKKRARKGAPN